MRRFGGREPDLLKIFFDCGAKVGGFEGAAKAREDFSLGREKKGVRDGFQGFEEVQGLGSWTNEWISDAVSLCKNEKTRGGGLVQRDAHDNEAAGSELFMQGDQFGKLLGAGGAPCGPEVKKEELAVDGGGVEGLA